MPSPWLLGMCPTPGWLALALSATGSTGLSTGRSPSTVSSSYFSGSSFSFVSATVALSLRIPLRTFSVRRVSGVVVFPKWHVHPVNCLLGPRLCSFNCLCPCLSLKRLRARFKKLNTPGQVEVNGTLYTYPPTVQEQILIDRMDAMFKQDINVMEIGDGAWGSFTGGWRSLNVRTLLCNLIAKLVIEN